METTQTLTLDHEAKSIKTNPFFIALIVMIPTFMVILNSSVANVALPHIAASFSINSEDAAWVLTCYLVANGIILPTTAWFCSMMGRKKFLLSCIITFTIASFVCGASTSIGMLLFARVLQGLGGGAVIPIAQSILLETFPHNKRALAMSIFGVAVMFAPIVGPTLGGWITDNYSWNWIFFINVPIGIMAAVMTHLFISDNFQIDDKEINKIDYIGFSALILWLVTLQVVLDKGQKADWFDSSWVCWFTFISVVSMLIFIFWELNFKDSIIDLKSFKDRNFVVGCLTAVFMTAVLYGTLAILPLFLQNLLKYPATLSGLTMMPRGFGCLVFICLTGILATKVKLKYLLATGFFIWAISCFMFGDLNLGVAMSSVVFPNVVCGCGLGMINAPLVTSTFETLNKAEVANATGLYNLLRNIGGGIGISVTNTLIIRNAQIHQNFMIAHLNPYDPVFQQRVSASTQALSHQMNSIVASHKAYGLIYKSMIGQANLFSYMDIFRLYGVICFMLIPLALFFKKASNVHAQNFHK